MRAVEVGFATELPWRRDPHEEGHTEGEGGADR